MENRTFANQSLQDGTKPKEWDVFVKPVVDKCRLLLQIPSMCPPCARSSNPQRKLQTAAMLVKQGLAASQVQESEWDKVVTAVQAHQVFKR
jgi:hypothetical protein